MTYQVIARKYRPQTFEEVIGQDPIVRTLKNAIEHNLVAHAYIFSGMRGVGKTTTARLLAKALNCVQGPRTKPCGECPPCREITTGTSIDVLEVDAASTGHVEEIRELLENARYLPARDHYKIFIIDEAHMLSPAACNALLKTLEEPPPRVLFILATTEPQKIIPTIHSRCQSFHFRSISFPEILDVLSRVAGQEGARVEPEALAVMTRAAEGSLRDALSVLDQAIAYCGTSITSDQVRELLGVVGEEILEEFIAAIADQDSEKMLRLVDQLVRDGHNLQHFCREALRHIRNLLVVRIGGVAASLAEAAGAERQKLEASARRFSEEDLLRFFNVLLRTEGELRWSPQPRLHLELGLLKLVQAARLIPLEEVLAELSNPASAGVSPRVSAEAAAPARREKRVPTEAPPAAQGAAEADSFALDAESIETLRAAVFQQSKFLGSFVESASRWERHQGNLTLWFPPESRTLIEMLNRTQQGQLERIVSEVLGEPVKVQAKVGTAEVSASVPARALAGGEVENPVVQALLERFGGSLRRGAPQASGPRSKPEKR